MNEIAIVWSYSTHAVTSVQCFRWYVYRDRFVDCVLESIEHIVTMWTGFNWRDVVTLVVNFGLHSSSALVL